MENLKLLRKEFDISQEKLAEKIGTQQQNIFRYENGINEPDIYTLKSLSDFFNVSIDYLVGNTYIRHKIENTKELTLSKDELELVEKYRKLNNTAQHGVINMIDTLLNS